MENLCPLLIRALEIDVAIQKAFNGLILHLHKNASPDFAWMEATIAAKKQAIDDWYGVMLEVEGGTGALEPLVSAYFENAGMDRYPAGLDLVLSKTRAKIAEGIVPEFKEGGLKWLVYDPKLYHNAETWALATELGVGLE